jgi:hypothetical protein
MGDRDDRAPHIKKTGIDGFFLSHGIHDQPLHPDCQFTTAGNKKGGNFFPPFLIIQKLIKLSPSSWQEPFS